MDPPNVLGGQAAVRSEDHCCEVPCRKQVGGMGLPVSAQARRLV